MVSCKLVFAFILAITLAIDVVRSSASGSRKSSPHRTESPSPYGSEPPSPRVSVPPSPRGPVRQSSYGSVPPSEHGSAPPSPHGPVRPSSHGSPPPSEHGSVPPSPRGPVRPSSYGSVPPSEHGSLPPSEHGSVPPSEHGSVPPSEHGSVPPSEHGTAPSSPRGSASSSPTRVEISVKERVPNKDRGEYNFGESVPGERLLGLPTRIQKEQPDPTFAVFGGVHTCGVTVWSPNGERITRVELDSSLGFQSEGEHVNFEGFNPKHDAVHIMIWSKRYTNIDYTIRLYGL